jgi:hypothetical protein
LAGHAVVDAKQQGSTIYLLRVVDPVRQCTDVSSFSKGRVRKSGKIGGNEDLLWRKHGILFVSSCRVGGASQAIGVLPSFMYAA